MSLFFILACGSPKSEEYTFTFGHKPTIDTAESESRYESASYCDIPTGSNELSPLELEGRLDCGADVYFNRCASCHGNEGQGSASGQPLMGQIDDLDDADLVFTIQFGQGDMPAQNLLSQDASDVITYLRDAFGNN